MAAATGGSLVRSMEQVYGLLAEHGLLYQQKVVSSFIGVHPSNRDGCGVSAKHVHELLADLVHNQLFLLSTVCQAVLDSRLACNAMLAVGASARGRMWWSSLSPMVTTWHRSGFTFFSTETIIPACLCGALWDEIALTYPRSLFSDRQLTSPGFACSRRKVTVLWSYL